MIKAKPVLKRMIPLLDAGATFMVTNYKDGFNDKQFEKLIKGLSKAGITATFKGEIMTLVKDRR